MKVKLQKSVMAQVNRGRKQNLKWKLQSCNSQVKNSRPGKKLVIGATSSKGFLVLNIQMMTKFST